MRAARSTRGSNDWRGVLVRRGLHAVIVSVAVSTVSFLMLHRLPGDAAFRVAAGRYGYDLVDAEAAASVRAELGLDRPMWQQWFDWLASLARLDLGTSMVTSRPVIDEVGYYLVGTLQLAAAALVFAVVIGVVVGVVASRRPGGRLDVMTIAWVAAVRSMPPFLLGLVLILVVSAQLGLLPAVGSGSVETLLLPALTLGLGLSGLIARLTRDTLVEVRSSEYMQFARTKGLPERWLVWRHAVRNTAVVLVPYLGAQAVFLIEGVVVVESVFSWQGLGHALVHAVFWRDVPVIQATVLILALLVVAINAVVDVLVLRLDPRPRGTDLPLAAHRSGRRPRDTVESRRQEVRS